MWSLSVLSCMCPEYLNFSFVWLGCSRKPSTAWFKTCTTWTVLMTDKKMCVCLCVCIALSILIETWAIKVPWTVRFWDIAQRVGIISYQRSRVWPLKMGPIGCPETSVRNYHYSLRNNPEEYSSHLLRRGSLKSRIVKRCIWSTALYLDTWESGSEITGDVWNVVLEKDGEEKLYRSCEKWRSIAQRSGEELLSKTRFWRKRQQGRTEVTGRWGIRRTPQLYDLKENRGYCKFKKEAPDRTQWNTSFVRGYGPVVGHTADCINWNITLWAKKKILGCW